MVEGQRLERGGIGATYRRVQIPFSCGRIFNAIIGPFNGSIIPKNRGFVHFKELGSVLLNSWVKGSVRGKESL